MVQRCRARSRRCQQGRVQVPTLVHRVSQPSEAANACCCRRRRRCPHRSAQRQRMRIRHVVTLSPCSAAAAAATVDNRPLLRHCKVVARTRGRSSGNGTSSQPMASLASTTQVSRNCLRVDRQRYQRRDGSARPHASADPSSKQPQRAATKRVPSLLASTVMASSCRHGR